MAWINEREYAIYTCAKCQVIHAPFHPGKCMNKKCQSSNIVQINVNGDDLEVMLENKGYLDSTGDC